MDTAVVPEAEEGVFDPKAFQYQEIVFALLMGVIAVLSRDNPIISYPEVLWAFEALFGFNFGYHFLLKRYRGLWFVPLISIAVNIPVISGILYFSGGYESYFWPMYLLPIFTACLYLERRHVILALSTSLAFLAYFYLESFWEMAPWQSLEFFIKLGVLALSAAVTMQVAFKERLFWNGLQKSREEIDQMARTLRRQEKLDLEAKKMQTLGGLVAGLLHNLNNPLTVILGSVQLMLQDAPEGSLQRKDLERIDMAARACSRLTSNLLATLQRDALLLEDADVGKVLRGALVHFDYQIKNRHLALKEVIAKDLPRMKVRTVSLQLALLDLLSRASEAAPEGGSLEIELAPEKDGVGIRIAYQTRDSGQGMKGLEACREVLSKSGNSFEAKQTPDGVEYLIHLVPGQGH